MNILLVEINPFIPPATPISISYIAAFLRKNGFNAKILNVGEKTPFSLRILQNHITQFRPKLVGFSVYQRNIFIVLGMAGYVKSIDPEIKVVIGGPQATFMPSSALESSDAIDFISRDEGEIALLNIAEAIRDGKNNPITPGSSCKCEDRLFHDGPSVESYKDLDEYPSPYLQNDLVDLSNLEEAILFTSRGCPYGCIFCYTPHAFKRKVRFHSIDRVIEEMQWISGKGIKKFWFADPSFSMDIARVDRLMEEILRRDIKAQIWLETRADLINDGLLKKMKEAGVYLVAYGLESASERVLEKLNKNISLEKLENAIHLTQRNGIDVELFTQYGLPNETFADAMKTLQFLKDNQVKIRGNSNSQQMQLYFGTDVFNCHGEFGIHPLVKDAPAYISIGKQYETEHLSCDALKKIRTIWEKESLDGAKRKVS